jgi:hypothetical protein
MNHSFENRCASTIWATNWHKASVIPAKAGIHPPLRRLDAGLRRHDESGACRGAAILYSVDGRKLMTEFVVKRIFRHFNKRQDHGMAIAFKDWVNGFHRVKK